MDIKEAERRFTSDAQFHAIVRAMVDAIEQLQMSPGEMRQAAVYAEIVFGREQSFARHRTLRDDFNQATEPAPPAV